MLNITITKNCKNLINSSLVEIDRKPKGQVGRLQSEWDQVHSYRGEHLGRSLLDQLSHNPGRSSKTQEDSHQKSAKQGRR